METKITEQLTPFTGSLTPAGFNKVTREASISRKARVSEAMGLWADALEGKLNPYFLQQAFSPSDEHAVRILCEKYPAVFQETMTTSDFNSLTVDVLDRLLYGNYTETPIPVMPLVKKTTLRDFRTVKRFMVDGMMTPFSVVDELAPVPQRALSQTQVTYAPSKYEAGTAVSWEAVVNDDLGIFTDIPQRLAIGARRTIHKFITSLFWSATGPNSTLFTPALANQVTVTNGALTNNPSLSIAGLQDAMTVLMRQRDPGGDPILIPGGLYLVVGPDLYVPAQNLMKQLIADINTQGGTSNQRVRIDNWIVGNMTPVMDPYIPIVLTSGTLSKTAWMIVADPASQGRPAVEVGFLSGYETPQLYQKVPNTMRIGGGVEPMLGDFNTMATEVKALMVFGGVQADGRTAVVSLGTNT
jgi:hypothetical protein